MLNFIKKTETKTKRKQGVVVHLCNFSYAEGGGRSGEIQGQPGQK
jgi:hypothetical protein